MDVFAAQFDASGSVQTRALLLESEEGQLPHLGGCTLFVFTRINHDSDGMCKTDTKAHTHAQPKPVPYCFPKVGHTIQGQMSVTVIKCHLFMFLHLETTETEKLLKESSREHNADVMLAVKTRGSSGESRSLRVERKTPEFHLDKENESAASQLVGWAALLYKMSGLKKLPCAALSLEPTKRW